MKKTRKILKRCVPAATLFFLVKRHLTFSGIFCFSIGDEREELYGNSRSHTHRPNFTKEREKGRWIDSHGAGRIRGPQGNVGHAGVQQRPPRLGQLAVSFVWHRCGTSKILSQDARILFFGETGIRSFGGYTLL